MVGVGRWVNHGVGHLAARCGVSHRFGNREPAGVEAQVADPAQDLASSTGDGQHNRFGGPRRGHYHHSVTPCSHRFDLGRLDLQVGDPALNA